MNSCFIKYNGNKIPVPEDTLVTVVDSNGKFTITKASNIKWYGYTLNDTYRHVYAYCIGIFININDFTLH
jgi:hypothetical protein